MAVEGQGVMDLVPRPKTWIDTVDITNDFLAGLPSNETHKQGFPNTMVEDKTHVVRYLLGPNEHMAIGLYLVSSGVVVGLINVLGLLAFVRFPRALLTPSAIPEVAVMLADLGVAGIHPYSGSSALANRWLWGPGGCQLYSISGFIFGDLQVILVNFVALDRYIVVCQPKWGQSFRSFKGYFRLLFFCFCVAAVFTVLPVVGLGSFGMLPTKIVCTLDYMRPDRSLAAYFTAKFLIVCVGPYTVGALSTIKALRRLRAEGAPKVHFTALESAGAVMWWSLLITPLCFSPYPLNIAIALILGPHSIPRPLIPLPPLSAKLAGLFNPIVFLYANPLMWACVRATIGKPHDEDLIQEVEDANDEEEERREVERAATKDESPEADRLHRPAPASPQVHRANSPAQRRRQV